MRKILAAIAITTLLASCQKEISFDTGNGGNTGGNGPGGAGPGGGTGGSGSTDGLLVKTVTVTGMESQTTIYTYDSQKRLETIKITGVANGIPVNDYHKYIRDNAGRIVKVLQKLETMPGVASDTAVITFHYPNATTMEFDYSIHVKSMDMGGFSMGTTDSAVYHYAGGKMTSNESYMFSDLMPGGPVMTTKWEYAYDASDRVVNMKTYTDAANPNSGSFDLDMEQKFTYANTTVNNVYFTSSPAQNYAMHALPNATANIVLKLESVSNTTAPPLNMVTTFTYVNGAGNKPVSGTAVIVSVGDPTVTTNYTFHYQ